MTTEKSGEERPQNPAKVTGLLISKHQGHVVRAYPGHLIFDAKSLFQEMMVLKEEVVDDDMKRTTEEVILCIGDQAAMTAATREGMERAERDQHEMTCCLALLARRCQVRPWVMGRRHLHRHLSQYLERAEPSSVAPADLDFVLDTDASDPTLLTSDRLALCARHTGPEILGIRLNPSELALRVEAALRAAESGEPLILARSHSNLEDWYSDRATD